MRRFVFVLIVGFLTFSCYIKAQELKAFPAAEGFGKLATGGRGGAVVTVTNLDDDSLGITPGSFRWAVNQYSSDFTVVFAVSGEIRLVRDLRVKKKNFTIAGQTAPGEGICFAGAAVNFGGSENFIIRHIRSRVGYLDVAGNIIEDNAFVAKNASNFIIDHCSFAWSVEETMNTVDNMFQTVQWCIISEGLYDSGHKKGARGYGTQWGGSQATYHHNLLAHNSSRSCRFNGARNEDRQVFIEYINNVNYNWGRSNSCYGGENTGGTYSIHEVNMVNNYYKPGPATPSSLYFVCPSYARDGATSVGPSKWHVSGNIMHDSDKITADNWLGVKANDSGYTEGEIRVDTLIIPDDSARLVKYITHYHTYTYSNYDSAEDAFNSIITVNEGAGAWPHDEIDRRIFQEVFEGTALYGNKGIINHPEDAEGYIVYSKDYTIPLDSDGDGIPDEWEEEYGLNPKDPTDGNYVNPIGYTALEAYLNSLVGESVGDYTFVVPPVDGIAVYESSNSSLALVTNLIDEEILIKESEELNVGSIYNINGVRMMNVNFGGSDVIQVGHLSAGHYILVVSTNEGEVKAARFIKK